jgi:metal-dependent amidase/aminoacylase/carboxypeptidase family protein
VSGNIKLGKSTVLGGVLLIAGGNAFANDVAASRLHSAIDADTPRLTAVFKDIHAHPELGFMETRTANVVAGELTALGFKVQTGIGRTGVVGILHNGPGAIVMYRADMDANAVEEATGLPLVNTDALVARLNVPLKALPGEQQVVTDMPAATGSEDVHLLLGEHTRVPFAYLLVGVADPAVFAQAPPEGKFVPYSAHNPNYIVDLAAIPVGTKVATTMVSELLAKH